MLDRSVRFLFGDVSTVLTVGFTLAIVWGVYHVGPSRVLFWIVIAPLLLVYGPYYVQLALRRRRGHDVRAERDAVARATAEEIRRSFAGHSRSGDR